MEISVAKETDVMKLLYLYVSSRLQSYYLFEIAMCTSMYQKFFWSPCHSTARKVGGRIPSSVCGCIFSLAHICPLML